MATSGSNQHNRPQLHEGWHIALPKCFEVLHSGAPLKRYEEKRFHFDASLRMSIAGAVDEDEDLTCQSSILVDHFDCHFKGRNYKTGVDAAIWLLEDISIPAKKIVLDNRTDQGWVKSIGIQYLLKFELSFDEPATFRNSDAYMAITGKALSPGAGHVPPKLKWSSVLSTGAAQEPLQKVEDLLLSDRRVPYRISSGIQWMSTDHCAIKTMTTKNNKMVLTRPLGTDSRELLSTDQTTTSKLMTPESDKSSDSARVERTHLPWSKDISTTTSAGQRETSPAQFPPEDTPSEPSVALKVLRPVRKGAKEPSIDLKHEHNRNESQISDEERYKVLSEKVGAHFSHGSGVYIEFLTAMSLYRRGVKTSSQTQVQTDRLLKDVLSLREETRRFLNRQVISSRSVSAQTTQKSQQIRSQRRRSDATNTTEPKSWHSRTPTPASEKTPVTPSNQEQRLQHVDEPEPSNEAPNEPQIESGDSAQSLQSAAGDDRPKRKLKQGPQRVGSSPLKKKRRLFNETRNTSAPARIRDLCDHTILELRSAPRLPTGETELTTSASSTVKHVVPGDDDESPLESRIVRNDAAQGQTPTRLELDEVTVEANEPRTQMHQMQQSQVVPPAIPSINARLRHRAGKVPARKARLGLPVRIRPRLAVPKAPDGVTFYRSITKRPLHEGEVLSDSEDDLDEEWLRLQHDALVEDYTDVTHEEKEFIKRFDAFFQSLSFLDQKHLYGNVREFAVTNTSWLRHPSWLAEFVKKGASLVRAELLDIQAIDECVSIVRQADDDMPVHDEGIKDIPTGDCKICGEDCEDFADTIFCDGPHCQSRHFHLRCLKMSTRADGWLCNTCTIDPAGV